MTILVEAALEMLAVNSAGVTRVYHVMDVRMFTQP